MTIPNDFFSNIALPLAELGYLVFPLQADSKIPMAGSSGCKDGTTDPATIKAWAAQYPNANVGIHCTGLVVIDLDEKDGKHGLADLDEVILDLGSLPNGPSVETPTDGRHLYFKAPAVTVKNAQGVKWKDRKTGIDIRTDGGYVVAPGSVIDGKKYVAASSLPHASELPELSSAWIDGFLTAKPPSVVVSEFVLPPGEFKGDVEKRAAAYVAAMPPAVQGQGGHDALLKVANAIFWGFGLDMATGWPIMLEYNQRCNPPWNLADPKDEKDFRRKMDQAREKPPTNPAGWLLENLSGSGEITLTPDISNIINQARTAMSQTPLPPRKPPFGVCSHEQLLKMDLTPHFLIENVLVEGQPMIVGAPRKCLKTSILLDMALSLATGKPFLGYFEVLKTSKVLMMSGESGLATILETINRIMQQKNKGRSLELLNADGKEVSVSWDRLNAQGVLPIADNVLISDAYRPCPTWSTWAL